MIGGATRGSGGRALGAHLADAKGHNEETRLGACRGLVGGTIRERIAELTDLAAHARSAKPLYHVHADPPPGAAFDEAAWGRYWQRFEAEFGLEGQPFAEAIHIKDNREHRHRVYSRVLPDGTCVRLDNDHARREKINRVTEFDEGLPFVGGAHNRTVAATLDKERPDVAEAMRAAGLTDTPRPRAVLTPSERHQQERTGVDKAAVQAAAWDAWRAADTGPGLEAALAERGLRLAAGDKGAVVVDHSGGVHSLARLVGAAAKADDGRRVRAAEVVARLDGLPLATLDNAKSAAKDAAAAKEAQHGQPRPERLRGSGADGAGTGATRSAPGGERADAWRDPYGGRRGAQQSQRDPRPAEPDGGRREQVGGDRHPIRRHFEQLDVAAWQGGRPVVPVAAVVVAAARLDLGGLADARERLIAASRAPSPDPRIAAVQARRVELAAAAAIPAAALDRLARQAQALRQASAPRTPEQPHADRPEAPAPRAGADRRAVIGNLDRGPRRTLDRSGNPRSDDRNGGRRAAGPHRGDHRDPARPAEGRPRDHGPARRHRADDPERFARLTAAARLRAAAQRPGAAARVAWCRQGARLVADRATEPPLARAQRVLAAGVAAYRARAKEFRAQAAAMRTTPAEVLRHHLRDQHRAVAEAKAARVAAVERRDRLEARFDRLGPIRRLFAGGLKRAVADARAAAETAVERHNEAMLSLVEAERVPHHISRASAEARESASQQRDLVAVADACESAARLLDKAATATVAAPRVTEAALGGDLVGAAAEATGRSLGKGGGRGGFGGGAPSSSAPSGADCGFAILSCGSDDPDAQARALQRFFQAWASAWESRNRRLAAASKPVVSVGPTPDPVYRGPRGR
ncbi:MAG TPA: hypothetical protein VD978_07770 [Azospirillum sp.]|nr:hypothetical protein [Azospirillum sp.]